MRYRITRGGVAFTAALLLVALAAALSANNLLFLIAAAMLATLLVSSFVSRLSLAGLQVDLLLPEHISARRPTPARIRLRNLKWIMPSVSIQISGAPEQRWPGIHSPYTDLLSAAAGTCGDRGNSRGLLSAARRAREQSLRLHYAISLRIYREEDQCRAKTRHAGLSGDRAAGRVGTPHAAAIRGDLESQSPGGEHDFYRIRPYVSSESARHLDWKSSARTGELQVREFAREQRQTLEIILDRRIAPGQEVWLETAVECCAFLAWEFQESPLVVRSPALPGAGSG